MPSVDDLLADLIGGDEFRAETAAGMLAQHGAAIYPELQQLLESTDSDKRWWAVRTLAGMSQPRGDWLERAANDASAEVRAAAALALASHPQETAAATLIRALGDDDNVVALLAVSALVAIGQAAVPGLMEAFDSSGVRARVQIMRALAEIRDPRAIRLMMRAMDESSALIHYWAQEGLEALGLNMIYMMPD
jgi:HEAT repeat protein